MERGAGRAVCSHPAFYVQTGKVWRPNRNGGCPRDDPHHGRCLGDSGEDTRRRRAGQATAPATEAMRVVVTLRATSLGRLRRHRPNAGDNSGRRSEEEKAQRKPDKPSPGHLDASIRLPGTAVNRGPADLAQGPLRCVRSPGSQDMALGVVGYAATGWQQDRGAERLRKIAARRSRFIGSVTR